MKRPPYWAKSLFPSIRANLVSWAFGRRFKPWLASTAFVEPLLVTLELPYQELLERWMWGADR